ncbi:MAG: TolC family protein, partial [Rhizomicrobium sp.]
MVAVTASAAAQSLSFEAAIQMVLARSDALVAARAGVDSQSHRANSLDYLDYPRVGIEAKALDSEKTVKLDLSGLQDSAASILPLLSSTYGAALASEIPASKVIGKHNSGIQSNILASLPLYTGGKIGATQQAAKAGVRQAGAELSLTEQTLRTQLAQIYFLYQLSLRVRDVRIEARNGLRLHLQNAQQSEKAGVTAHAQTLQAKVAYDETERNLIQAEADMHSAAVALANLLHVNATPQVASPLFVGSQPLPPVRQFIDTALEKHAQLARLAAIDDAAGQAVRIEGAERLPQVYVFGEYNVAGRNWNLTMPDWAFGLGVRYELFSGINRSEAEEAAVGRQTQVQAQIRQTRNDLETMVTRAYNDLSAAQERFRLTESNIVSAQENVRVQSASFHSGYATSIDVVDARLALSR